MDLNKHFTNPRLTISLLAALGQGLLLAWVHTRLSLGEWPHGDPSWLVALCSVAVVTPVAFHILAEHWRSPFLWASLSGVGAAAFYFGWNFGAHIGPALFEHGFGDEAVPFALSMTVFWLLCLPFVRRRLVTGRWRGQYDDLFTLAWQSKIALAEAVAFTGALWLLIQLWAMLFQSLGFELFERFFHWPGFVYVFTALAFATALYLTGSMERVVVVVREQVLGLLKWLAPVAALILALFAPTLLLKLRDLVFSGENAISAAWLLWLVAVFVLLLNAAFQNGRQERPYPAPLAFALRCIVPALLIVSITALYALWVRVDEYGLTIARTNAFIVALAALAYAVGYSLAALGRGPWMQGIARANVVIALGIIAVIALTLTPIASPARLSASSQAKHVATLTDREARESALSYLRFETGLYGIHALQALSAATGDAAVLRLAEQAKRALKLESRWDNSDFLGPHVVQDFEIFPVGRELEPSLRKTILDGREFTRRNTGDHSATRVRISVLFVDLNSNGTEEAVAIAPDRYAVFARRGIGWRSVGSGPVPLCDRSDEVRTALAAADYAAVPARWLDLRIGSLVLPLSRTIFRIDDDPPVRRTASHGCNAPNATAEASDSMG